MGHSVSESAKEPWMPLLWKQKKNDSLLVVLIVWEMFVLMVLCEICSPPMLPSKERPVMVKKLPGKAAP